MQSSAVTNVNARFQPFVAGKRPNSRSAPRIVARAHQDEIAGAAENVKRAAVTALAAAQIALLPSAGIAAEARSNGFPLLAISADDVAGKVSQAASDVKGQASGAVDQAKGKAGDATNTGNPVSNAVDKLKGAGKSATSGGGIDTKPVSFVNTTAPQVSVDFKGPGDVADKVSQAASDVKGQASGAADKAKGKAGDATNTGNPLSNAVDQLKGAGKSATSGGIDTKPVSWSSAALQVNVGGPNDVADKVSQAASDAKGQASGAVDKAKGKAGDATNTGNPLSNAVDQLKGAGKSATSGGIDTKPVSWSSAALQVNVGGPGDVADKVSQAASDVKGQGSGAVDKAKGKAGDATNTGNPLSNAVDQLKGAGKSATSGGIDTKPVSFNLYPNLQHDVVGVDVGSKEVGAKDRPKTDAPGPATQLNKKADQVADNLEKAKDAGKSALSGSIDTKPVSFNLYSGLQHNVVGVDVGSKEVGPKDRPKTDAPGLGTQLAKKGDQVADNLDKAKEAGKSALSGGIDKKPVSYDYSKLQHNVVGVDVGSKEVGPKDRPKTDAPGAATQLAKKGDQVADNLEKAKEAGKSALSGSIDTKPVSFDISKLQHNVVGVDVGNREVGDKNRPKTDAPDPVTQLNKKADQIADNVQKGADKAQDAAKGGISTKPVALYNRSALQHNVSFGRTAVLGEVGIPSLRDASGDGGAYAQSGTREPIKSGDTKVAADVKGGDATKKSFQRDDSLESEGKAATSEDAISDEKKI